MKGDILVVDDQLGIRLLLTDVFTSIGYQVTVAETGEEALNKIYKECFDLIILDYRLPILNGQEIIERMVIDEIDVPVILMSGLIESIKKEEIKGTMIIKYIAKPFNINDVRQMVKNILQLKQ